MEENSLVPVDLTWKDDYKKPWSREATERGGILQNQERRTSCRESENLGKYSGLAFSSMVSWFMLLVVAKSNKILKMFPMYTEKKTENNWKLKFNLAPAEHRGKVPAFCLHW